MDIKVGSAPGPSFAQTAAKKREEAEALMDIKVGSAPGPSFAQTAAKKREEAEALMDIKVGSAPGPSFAQTAAKKREVGSAPGPSFAQTAAKKREEAEALMDIMVGSAPGPSFAQTAAKKREEAEALMDIKVGSAPGPSFAQTAAKKREVGSAPGPSFAQTAAKKREEAEALMDIMVGSAPGPSFAQTAAKKREEAEALMDIKVGSAPGPSFAQTAAKKRAEVTYQKKKRAEELKTIVESDNGKYPSLSESGGDQYEFIKSSKKASTPAKKSVKVGDMILGQSVPSQKKMIVRLYSEALTKATVGDEIFEEEAVCKHCFAKLDSNDTTLRTHCGCTEVLIHGKCVDDWCKYYYDKKDSCDRCGKEVQKLPVILINDVIPGKSESSKWSWSSWLKRKQALLVTSWKPTNPGRRFWGCAQRSCDFFCWKDSEMCARSTQIIPGLLNRLNNMEAEIKQKKAEIASYKHQIEEYEEQVAFYGNKKEEKKIFIGESSELELQLKKKNSTIKMQKKVICVLCFAIFIMWLVMPKSEDMNNKKSELM